MSGDHATGRCCCFVSPRTVVRRGELNAKVTCWLRFAPEEIAATREIFRLAEISESVPDVPEVKLTWIYPAPPRKQSEFPVSATAYSTNVTTGRQLFPNLNPTQL